MPSYENRQTKLPQPQPKMIEHMPSTLTKLAEVKIGRWPQGAAWSREGKTLLAQSMADNAIAIVSFDGKSLNVTGQVELPAGPTASARLGVEPFLNGWSMYRFRPRNGRPRSSRQPGA
jgi:hypothetical protein